MTLSTLLPYLIPPLLGAFIGYVTNHIAIRMLFRPLKPWKIFGMRLPLTPGIIPSKRGELAMRMGEMVGSHLLTSEDVGRVLEKDSFRRELRAVVTEKLGAFLDRELGPAITLVPADYHPRVRDLVDLLRWKLAKSIFAYLESPACQAQLLAFLRHQGNQLLARDLESFLTPERYDRLRQQLDERLGSLLHSAGMEKAVVTFVDHKSAELLASQRPIRELLPADLVEFILLQLEREVPSLLDKFGGLLYDPVFRDRLAQRAKAGIDKFLDSLQGFAGLLSGFVSLDKINARLPEFFDQASDEIAKWLREEKTQQQVAQILRGRIEALLERSLASYVEGVSYEKVAEVRELLRMQAVKLLRSPKTQEALLGAVEQGLGRVKDRPFGELLAGALPEGGVERALEATGHGLLTMLRSGAARELVEQTLDTLAEAALARKPLGKLSARIPADLREEAEEALGRQLADLLKREVPPLVETLNVRRMVTDKVNSLDVLKVEGLLLSIMQEQFKYINLFGALLGFLIGLANLLLLSLT